MELIRSQKGGSTTVTSTQVYRIEKGMKIGDYEQVIKQIFNQYSDYAGNIQTSTFGDFGAVIVTALDGNANSVSGKDSH